MKAIVTCILMTLAGCATKSPVDAPFAFSSTAEKILVLSDPQIHNVYGLGVKQMTPVADVISKVAVRAPELNLLAPLVLEELAARGMESQPKAVLVLGDIGNIGCSTEVDRFFSIMKADLRKGTPMILAHGNHDTYLMGTLNSFTPGNGTLAWPPESDGGAWPSPVDRSWWGDVPEKLRELNWRDACYDPQQGSPMNKGRWLAKYLRSLQPLEAVDSQSLTEMNGARLTVQHMRAAAGTALERLQFQGHLVWYPPSFTSRSKPETFNVSYRSFILQRFVIERTTLIVIDTSVCELARGNTDFWRTNAGTNACLGDRQLGMLAQYIQDVPHDHRVVLAGHFPLKDLTADDRDRLLRLLKDRGDWLYLSGHTHNARSVTTWGHGKEFNLGSTTDWPMEANIVSLPPMPQSAGVTTFYNNRIVPVTYRRASRAEQKFEVCRHLPVAQKLADLVMSGQQDVTWRSPESGVPCDITELEQWKRMNDSLKQAIEKIGTRFHSDLQYRNVVLGIAAAASEAEARSWSFADIIP